MPITYTEKVT